MSETTASSDSVEFVDFFGERFALPRRFNSRLLWRFMRAADDGIDSESAEGIVLMDKLLDAVVRPEDHKRFDQVCDRECPDDEQLIEFAMEAVQKIAARPTGRPSDSSDGPRTTSTSSAGDSSSPVIARLEERGRPDLALIVAQAQESRASA